MNDHFNIEEHMDSHDESKNLKKSIRDKYKRRIKWLADALDDLIEHAEYRLDESRAGKIRNREETEDILSRAKTFREILPSSNDNDNDSQLNSDLIKNLNDLFGIAND